MLRLTVLHVALRKPALCEKRQFVKSQTLSPTGISDISYVLPLRFVWVSLQKPLQFFL